MDVTKAIATIAQKQGITEKQVRADIVVAIHKAFLANGPAFTILFENREPSPEEFINTITKDITSITLQQ